MLRQITLPVETLGDILNGDDQTSDSFVFTQRRDVHTLLHLVETLRGSERSAGDQVMMKRGREHFDDALVQHTVETREQSSLFQVWDERDERLAGRRFRTDTCEARQCGVPYLDDEIRVRCEDADRLLLRGSYGH